MLAGKPVAYRCGGYCAARSVGEGCQSGAGFGGDGGNVFRHHPASVVGCARESNGRGRGIDVKTASLTYV
jgi:hypothetical protein